MASFLIRKKKRKKKEKDHRVGHFHQVPYVQMSWALKWMHYKVRVCAFPNNNCFLWELIAPEVLQVISELRSWVFEPQGCCWGEDCWQIGGLAVSINSSIFECHRRLGECTIRLGYAPFQTTIAFRRVDIAWGRTKSFMASVSFSFELRWSSLRGRPAYSRKDGEV